MNGNITVHGSPEQLEAYQSRHTSIHHAATNLKVINNFAAELYEWITRLFVYVACLWIASTSNHPYADSLANTVKYTLSLMIAWRLLGFVRSWSYAECQRSLATYHIKMVNTGNEYKSVKYLWIDYLGGIHFWLNLIITLAVALVISLYIDDLVLPVVVLVK